ncbi:unnamed protein product [Moneuplotes crassus]|uniref:Protein-tyrosine-phosphatase n=1 Tax=Euplotes crassus TaxID=5936 RepID=A0AAD1X8K9_EUPCR|nr:unnamed protein product [Moneuplotes crassus]
MKKFGLSLEIPSDEEKEAQEPAQQLDTYESHESEDYQEGEESEEEPSREIEENLGFQNTNGHEQTSDQEESDILLEPKPPAVGTKPTGFGFGGKPGLSLNVEDSDEKESQPEEIQIEEKNQDSAEAPIDDGIQIEGVESTGDISYKWVEALKNIQIVEKAIPFSQFYKSFALRETSREFKLIRRLTETEFHRSQIIKRKKGKDRYSDLGPFKHSQVKLRSNTKVFEAEVDNYINANYIKSATQRNLFIATQGPLETTFLNFYRMVWQEKVSLIFMLCPLMEDEKKKCSEYWPHEGTEKTLNIDDQFLITFEEVVESSEEIINKCCKIRKLKIKNIAKNEERIFTHYNMLSWPDFGTPEENEYTIIEDIVAKIQEIEDNEKSKEKIIVHCSAGIGRTGTLIAIYNCVCTIEHYIKTDNIKNGKLSIFAVVRRLREQRFHMVHNELQYHFIYQFIHHYFNMKEIDDTETYIRPCEMEKNKTKIKSQSEEEPETKSNYSNYSYEGESNRSGEEMVESKPVIYDDEIENPDLQLDLLNKPPPIQRNKKPPMLF